MFSFVANIQCSQRPVYQKVGKNGKAVRHHRKAVCFPSQAAQISAISKKGRGEIVRFISVNCSVPSFVESAPRSAEGDFEDKSSLDKAILVPYVYKYFGNTAITTIHSQTLPCPHLTPVIPGRPRHVRANGTRACRCSGQVSAATVGQVCGAGPEPEQLVTAISRAGLGASEHHRERRTGMLPSALERER